MVRGLEIILKGRDPRDAWAFAERVCGVCTTVHALASVRSVEDALAIKIPPNAELIRNIMFCTQYIHDHVVHFYHLHALDWVDVVSALKADPVATSQLAQKTLQVFQELAELFLRVQKRLTKFVESGQLGIFANGYWGHPAFKLPAEANLMAVAHYLEALEWQKEIVKIHTIFGGKNPHPNYLVGGAPCSINLDEANAINAERLAFVGQALQRGLEFVEQVYMPDVLAVAPFYLDWAAIGGGLENYLCYGDLPTQRIFRHRQFQVSARCHPRPQPRPRSIRWTPRTTPACRSSSTTRGMNTPARADGKHPWQGETKLNYSGPKPPYEHLDVDQKYSWLKTPRWKGHAMEVGPLARMLVGYASGQPEIKEAVTEALAALNATPAVLFSTLGRTAARAIEIETRRPLGP